MKFYLLNLFVLSLFFANSQSLVLTQANNEPHVGDSSYYYVLDSSAYLNTLPVAVSGSNSLWNFTNLNVLGISANSAYLSPATVSNSANYPGTTVVQKQGGLYNFYKSVTSPNAQTEMLGTVSNTSSLTFTNTAILVQYPVGFGSSFTDNVAGVFTFSVNGSFTGSVSSSADGTGTLQLPGGVVFTNVLRVKSVQQLNLNLGIIPFGTARQTVYNYFHASQKFPILNITYTSLSLLGSSSPSLSAVVTANSKVVTVGSEELSNFENRIRVFPNPAGEFIRVSCSETLAEPLTLTLFNALGSQIFTYKTNYSNKDLDLRELPNGIYLLSISGGSGKCIKKLIVQH